MNGATAPNLLTAGNDIDVRTFTQQVAEEPHRLEEFRKQVDANPVYRGSLVSRDGRTAAFAGADQAGSAGDRPVASGVVEEPLPVRSGVEPDRVTAVLHRHRRLSPAEPVLVQQADQTKSVEGHPLDI